MSNLLNNKKARFDYEILDTFEAGLVLFGHEVKALRKGMGKLNGAHVSIHDGEAYLLGSSVSPFQAANTPKEYDPERARKLLLSKKQLEELEKKSLQPGLTLVPIRLYSTGKLLKVEIAVARGKKQTDKRETIKKRENKIAIERILKNQ